MLLEWVQLRPDQVHIPSSWTKVARRFHQGNATLLILGGPDAGKTTLARYLIGELAPAGPVAFLDGDMGQSTLGPPATLGLAFVPSQRSLPNFLNPALYFIGATSPMGHFLPTVVGHRKLLDAARAAGARTVVIDTTGLVAGGAARELKQRKIELLRPDALLCLQRAGELEHILRPYRAAGHPQVVELPVSRSARPKSPDQRREHRERKFRDYFRKSKEHHLSTQTRALWNFPFFAGRSLLPSRRNSLASGLHTSLLHAEVVEGHANAVAAADVPFPVRVALARQMGLESLSVYAAADFQNRLLGLEDSRGEILALALLQKIDFQRQVLKIVAPLANMGDVHGVRMGDLRVDRAGKQLSLSRKG
ncbi:MAG: hypothetical protein HY652_02375 [Acidobacteria bacterium]|nr:hypothetical protein [Acidobacteriota bacterium]